MHRLMSVSLIGLIGLCVMWETVLAPASPNWQIRIVFAAKALPLMLPLIGVLRRDIYTLQWSSMFILLYFIEGVVRGFRNPDHVVALLAWSETALVVLFFVAALAYLRPIKRAAKLAAREAIKRAQATPPDQAPH